MKATNNNNSGLSTYYTLGQKNQTMVERERRFSVFLFSIFYISVRHGRIVKIYDRLAHASAVCGPDAGGKKKMEGTDSALRSQSSLPSSSGPGRQQLSAQHGPLFFFFLSKRIFGQSESHLLFLCRRSCVLNWPPAFTPIFATGQQTDSYRAVDIGRERERGKTEKKKYHLLWIFFSQVVSSAKSWNIYIYVIFRSIITYSSRPYLNIDERNDDGTIPRRAPWFQKKMKADFN